jgi:hypothetical protein
MIKEVAIKKTGVKEIMGIASEISVVASARYVRIVAMTFRLVVMATAKRNRSPIAGIPDREAIKRRKNAVVRKLPAASTWGCIDRSIFFVAI